MAFWMRPLAARGRAKLRLSWSHLGPLADAAHNSASLHRHFYARKKHLLYFLAVSFTLVVLAWYAALNDAAQLYRERAHAMQAGAGGQDYGESDGTVRSGLPRLAGPACLPGGYFTLALPCTALHSLPLPRAPLSAALCASEWVAVVPCIFPKLRSRCGAAIWRN